MKYTASITAQNTTVYLCHIRKKRDLSQWTGAMNIYGTFGGGTLTLYISTDGGTTKVPWMDISGSPYTATSDDNFITNWGRGSKNSDMPIVYAGIGTATTPSITIDCFDNN